MVIDPKQYQREFQAAGLDFEYGEDVPGKIYTPHTHGWTKLITLDGSIRLRTSQGWVEQYAGDVCEVRSGELHEGIVGANGWKWLAAWKPEEADTFSVHES